MPGVRTNLLPVPLLFVRWLNPVKLAVCGPVPACGETSLWKKLPVGKPESAEISTQKVPPKACPLHVNVSCPSCASVKSVLRQFGNASARSIFNALGASGDTVGDGEGEGEGDGEGQAAGILNDLTWLCTPEVIVPSA